MVLNLAEKAMEVFMLLLVAMVAITRTTAITMDMQIPSTLLLLASSLCVM